MPRSLWVVSQRPKYGDDGELSDNEPMAFHAGHSAEEADAIACEPSCRDPEEDVYGEPTEYVHIDEVARLRAALQAIAERQPTQHVGDAHRGTMHDDRKSAYYCGVSDGRKDGLFEAAEMARAALGGGT